MIECNGMLCNAMQWNLCNAMKSMQCNVNSEQMFLADGDDGNHLGFSHHTNRIQHKRIH